MNTTHVPQLHENLFLEFVREISREEEGGREREERNRHRGRENSQGEDETCKNERGGDLASSFRLLRLGTCSSRHRERDVRRTQTQSSCRQSSRAKSKQSGATRNRTWCWL